MPLVIGLTGRIGCGKSHVLETLEALGAEGIDADKVAHDVLAPGAPAYQPVIAAFGAELVRADGTVDRAKLGAQVFRDPAALARLETIVHPAVHEATKAIIESSDAPVVVIEAIKLLEAGLSVSMCDQVWVVVCSENDQIERLARSRGLTADEVRRRSSNQMRQDEMARQADLVIDTSGTLAETEEKVRQAWQQLGLRLPPEAGNAKTLE
jgi:dephospho-CoA kinase